MIKKIIGITVGLVLVLVSCSYAATLTKGESFTSTDTVTNERLHDLVDDATIADIEQTDIKANYGLAVRSSTQPGDTDSLWVDTSNNYLAAYVSGAYEEVGSTPSSVTTGALSATTGAFSSTLAATGASTLTGNVSMAGTLTVSGDSTVNGVLYVGTNNLSELSPKAWVKFNGTGTAAIADSFNVSALTDNSTGNYTIDWDVDFADTNYCVVTGTDTAGPVRLVTLATDTCNFTTVDSGGNATDAAIVCLIAIGDQ